MVHEYDDVSETELEVKSEGTNKNNVERQIKTNLQSIREMKKKDYLDSLQKQEKELYQKTKLIKGSNTRHMEDSTAEEEAMQIRRNLTRLRQFTAFSSHILLTDHLNYDIICSPKKADSGSLMVAITTTNSKEERVAYLISSKQRFVRHIIQGQFINTTWTKCRCTMAEWCKFTLSTVHEATLWTMGTLTPRTIDAVTYGSGAGLLKPRFLVPVERLG